MVKVSYVYPNVCELAHLRVKPRGGLLERWQLAKEFHCDYIEVPADFIKNKTEIEKARLNLGDFLTDEAIDCLYERDEAVPKETKYILHTEPSLIRRNPYGVAYQPSLKWWDEGWRKCFAKMTISISKHLGIPAAAIEIHPGDKSNTFIGITESIITLLKEYDEAFRHKPFILIENRTQQLISSGTEIESFWNFLSANYPELKNIMGIILDVHQLFTQTGKNFEKEFCKIPLESIKGLHVYSGGHFKIPSLDDKIPWRTVFEKIANAEGLLINPEVSHKKMVKDTISFCEKMLNLTTNLI